jgi:CDP-4-dehydro-6-deoxyglucose reductase, E3
MHKVLLNNGESFECGENDTIITAALKNGVFLDHSCLLGRCSSCKFKVLYGKTTTEFDETPLTESEKSEGFILTCIRKPLTDIKLDAEDLSPYGFTPSNIIPAKINAIDKLTPDIIQIGLRVPPKQKLSFLEGQYLNVIWKGIKRSYSIASSASSSEIQLIIKNVSGGKMSDYWFNHAKVNDLFRLEIAKGTFFLRNHIAKKTIVFLATGTGIAPIKAILESPLNIAKLSKYEGVFVLWGMKYERELFWKPTSDFINFIPVLSRETQLKQYVQDQIKKLDLNWSNSIIYACGSNQMIQAAKQISIQQGINSNDFYSDAFVASN